MGSCFPGLSSLLCSTVVCKYSLRYLVFIKFQYCMKKGGTLAGSFHSFLQVFQRGFLQKTSNFDGKEWSI